MSAREIAGDRDWWTPHVLIAIFCVLVAAILAAVPGWTAPLHAWIALAGLVIAALVAHAGARVVVSVVRRRWRGALIALLLAAALGASAAMLMKYGHSRMVTVDDALTPSLPAVAEGAR